MTNFLVESWTWYSVTLCLVIARYTARWLHFKNIKKFQAEDWLMLFLTCLYTILIVFLNIDLNVSTNLIDPKHPINLTPHEIDKRRWGSKTILLVEQCMCAVQWGCKACLLLLFWRLTQNLTQNLIVKGAAIYVGVTYIVMIILYFAVWCRPFSDYWETPTTNKQCTTALDHLITNLAFNLTSDILIMSIPLPLFLKAHLEIKRKLLLIFPFSLGFFTIVCAILSKHLSFTNPYSAEWVFWYCREASTAMIVTNMPYSWAIIRRVFKLKSFFGDSSTSRMQGGHMESVQGQSLGDVSLANQEKARAQSQAASGSEKQKRSWPWHKASMKNDVSTNSRTPFAEEGQVQAQSADIEKETNINASAASTSENSAGSARRPPTGKTADSAAVDKLYRLDFDEDDEDFERSEVAQRGYDG